MRRNDLLLIWVCDIPEIRDDLDHLSIFLKL